MTTINSNIKDQKLLIPTLTATTKHIIFTGPESTGKTTLAMRLAHDFNLPLVHECAREYIAKLDRRYNIDDLRQIALLQTNHAERYSNHPTVVHDTDILTIHIWAQQVFNTDEFLSLFLLSLDASKLYLLMKDDLAWQYDAQRENPENRAMLFDAYEKCLKSSGAHFTIIEGQGELRYAKVCKAVDLITI